MIDDRWTLGVARKDTAIPVSCGDDVEPGRALKILRALREAAPWGRAIACVALIFQAIAIEPHPVIASSRED